MDSHRKSVIWKTRWYKKIKYLDWLYKTDLNKEPCTTIEDLLKYSMELANKIDINKKNRLLPIEERIITKEDDE